jgi:hypothetical protein
MYPQFFRKGGVCIKRESDTLGNRIELPEPCKSPTANYVQLSVDSKVSFDNLVTGMETVSAEVYKNYLQVVYRLNRKSGDANLKGNVHMQNPAQKQRNVYESIH